MPHALGAVAGATTSPIANPHTMNRASRTRTIPAGSNSASERTRAGMRAEIEREKPP